MYFENELLKFGIGKKPQKIRNIIQEYNEEQ